MNRLLGSAVALAAASAPHPAASELVCYPLAQIEHALDGAFGESRSFAGKDAAGIAYRLYLNSRTGSWSWIGIPAGAEIGCLIFAGRSDDTPAAQPPKPQLAQF